MREEVDNDLGPFALSNEPTLECNSLIVVATVGASHSRVPVDSVACFSKWCSPMLLRSPFLVAHLYSFSRVVVSAGLTDISGLAVKEFDLLNRCKIDHFPSSCGNVSRQQESFSGIQSLR